MLSVFAAFSVFVILCDSYIPECKKYESCSNDLINSTTNETLYCNGAQSCNNSWLRSSLVWCYGYSSCYNSTTISYGHTDWEQQCNGYGSCMQSNLSSLNYITCNAPYSCSGSNLKFLADGTTQAQCTGLHSCIILLLNLLHLLMRYPLSHKEILS